jgi:hypothetical protein
MMQTARARLDMGNGRATLQNTIQAMRWPQQDRRWLVLRKLGDRAAASFETSGFSEEAALVREFVEQAAPETDASDEFRIEVNPEAFPEKCPNCGGTIHIDLIESQHDGSVSCAYRGSRIDSRI